ncbi:myosin-1-like [Lytechinus variegatus]|uniref:myosin-1-like n=1 Tax=Lytechinus variegatus TaxID=7654 RepID=UPI001BB2681A|nr:myosin-1-like [Lytechinus variegatus]
MTHTYTLRSDDIPLVGIYADVVGNVNEATIELKKHGIHDIYKVPVSNAHFNDEDRLPWLELLRACIQGGERVIQHNALSLIREIEQREQENESLRNNTKQLERKLEQSQATQDKMKNEIAGLKKGISKERWKSKEMEVSLSENEKRAKDDKEKCRKERIVMEEKMRAKDQQLLNLKRKLTSTEQKEKTLKDEMEKVKTERSELSKKLDSSKRKIDEQKRNETTLLQNIKQLKARIAEAEKEQPSVSAERKQELESLQQSERSLQRKLVEKERKVKSLTQKMDQLTEKHTQDTKKMELERESWQRREKTLQGKIKTLTQNKKQLTEDYENDKEKMENDKRVLAADMKEREKSLMQINIKLEHVEEEKRSLEEELKKREEEALKRTVAEKEREAVSVKRKTEESHRTWEEKRTRLEEEISSLESSWKIERDIRQQRTWRMEQLEREAKKLRNKIQRESEIRQWEKKNQRQWMQTFITWVSPRKDNRHEPSMYSNMSNVMGGMYGDATSQTSLREEPPNDDFAQILKQIADDLYDDASIDSLGGQLGIIQGDIERAIKTNMRFHQITSNGTYGMLKEWRRGVPREDERIELKRALVAAKLTKLAEDYFPEEGPSGFEDGRTDILHFREEVQEDEFACILTRIADDLVDERQIESLGRHLRIQQGDIERALKNNVRFNNVTRDGTLHMLKQWRKGVSRTDERVVLRKAMLAANLIELTDRYLSELALTQGQSGSGDQVLNLLPCSTMDLRGSTEDLEPPNEPAEGVHPAGLTNVGMSPPSKPPTDNDGDTTPDEDVSRSTARECLGAEKINEESLTYNQAHVDSTIVQRTDTISQLVFIDPTWEKMLIAIMLSVLLDVHKKTLEA